MEVFFIGKEHYDLLALGARLLVAITLLPFGMKKFLNRKESHAEFPAVLGFSSSTSFYLALFAETFAPLCLIAGFFTRVAALGGILNMGIAYWAFSKGDGFKSTPFYYAPALPILLGYILIFLAGPGKISLDYLMFS